MNVTAKVVDCTPSDTTPPVISYTVTGTLGDNDWYTSDVVIDWTVTDNESSFTINEGCVDTTINSDTSGVTLTCSAASAGGTSSASVTIKRDATAPTISAALDKSPANTGWFNASTGAPKVTYTCADALSGVASCTAPYTFGEGADQSHTGAAVDNAGNSATAGVSDIDVDLTAPSISASVSPARPSSGWWNIASGAPTVSFTCSDATSGLADACPDDYTFGEGANQSYSQTIYDKAGNSATAGVSDIDVDLTAPTVTVAPDRAPDHNGWYNHEVTFTTSGSDATSGIASCSADQTYSGPDGTGLTVSGSCTDNAGNIGYGTSAEFKYDATAPTISAALDKSPASTGWFNASTGAPTVSFTCSDATSGLVDACPDDYTFGEGKNQSYSQTIYDNAGNSATAGVSNIDVDLTAPSISATLDKSPASTGWFNASTGAPTVSFTCNDATSGLAGACPDDYTFGEGEDQSYSQTIYDNAGNSATAGVSDIDVDLTAPSLEPTVYPNPVVLNGPATASPNATDHTSGVASAACAAVDTSSVGSKSVSCTATDNAGNTSTATASYSVIYAAGGMCWGAPGHQILQPINADGSSVFKQKSTVPAKFRVCDYYGNSIGAPGVVTSFVMYKVVSGTIETEVNEPVISTTPDTAFRWSADEQQWIFNISTKNLSVGKTYYYRITLNDGSTIEFSFGLK